MDHTSRFPASAVLASLLVAGWAFAGSGCETHAPPDQLAQAVKTGEKPVAMRGESSFFGGTVSATVTVSQGIGKGLEPAKGSKGKRVKEETSTMPDVSAMDDDEATAYMRARRAVGSPLPPVTIHLKLANLTDAPVEVDVADFDSDLGNFAVEPSPLKLAARQEVEPDPMISQLGVTTDDIPFKVTLKLAGKKESQTIHVRSLIPTEPAKQ